ncbi:MAG: chromosome segregation protein SMC [Candidatus Omnitrophica bacterium]|nr:chromosome segregation protein SMC [Candidatus Omnitrophota bacterium]
MYFKSIELYGFKSFAEKTVLKFEPGITAIVGPNGCGKSNISDAIKWVLGEQNPRELRGSRMEDVIFNGTSIKEPVNFAEVSLTLSNEDKIFPIEYAEITVTRRLFRSGESEYLLNKVPVRLKDIQELFFGTGIGTSSYSLLEQGKIDLVLSSRGEDRRFIFEEAAGITKFKSQKKEALRKLEDTENNLIRVNDIISEVSRQLSSLERQARKAERYQEIFNILKDKELKYSKSLMLQLEGKKEALLKEKEALQKEEEKILRDLSSGEERLKERREKLESLEKEISSEESRKAYLEASLEKNQSKIMLDSERIKELEERNIVLVEENKRLEEKRDNERRMLTELKVQFDDFCKDEEEKKNLLKNKQDLLNSLNQQIKEGESLISNYRLQLMDVNQGMARVRNELTKLKTEISSFQARLRRLELEKAKADEEKGKLDSLYTQRCQILEDKKLVLYNKVKDIEELDNRIGKLNKDLDDLTGELQKKEVEYNTLASRIDLMKEMEAHYEGYSPGVKSLILAYKNGALGEAAIIGPLAEMLEVDKGYEKAVEAVLGENAQAILIKDYRSLSLCLDYIREHNLGGVNFLVLEDIEKNVVSSLNIEGKFSYLINFVRLVPYEIVLSYLFSNTVLVNNLEEGIGLKRERGDLSLCLVTCQGDVMRDNFIKTAYVSIDEDTSIIGRRRKIEDLKLELVSLGKEKDKLSQDKESLSLTLNQTKEELVNKEEEKHLIEIELSNLNQEVERIGKDLGRVKDELGIVDLEIEESREEVNSRDGKIKESENRLKDLELRESEIQRLLEETTRNLEDRNALREKTLLEITELESSLNSYSEKATLLNERIYSLENSVAETERMFLTRLEERNINLEKIKLLNEEISSLEKEKGVFNKEIENSVKKLDDLNAKKNYFKNEIEEEEDSLGTMQKSLDKIKNGIHELEIKMQGIDFDKRDILQKIESNYKINLETAKVDFTAEDFDEHILKEEISSLQDKLLSLGPVNLIAIEEFGQLQERHSFLLNQQSDLLKAKESLHEAINRINHTAKEMFIDTFQKIGVNFKEIFRLLFGGGNSQLFLLEPENVLESGIEIIAQPPGKKLQNINLLSGGEKALTAVALLFAIFKVKPSPFCILDEVDAPLDESNIDRFRMLMKEFSKTSQFIVITHNKKTIAVADVMYGVTMEESGVSKLVSVKFSDVSENTKVEARKN